MSVSNRGGINLIADALDNQWEESLDGRTKDVPKPAIRRGADIREVRFDQFSGDLIFVVDGGPQSIEAKGAGWNHEGIEALTTIDIRTSRGRARLEGVADPDTGEPERYGGLAGEAKRILDDMRQGVGPWDIVEVYEWNDLSADVGYAFWRGTWEVRLRQIATSIDPSP